MKGLKTAPKKISLGQSRAVPWKMVFQSQAGAERSKAALGEPHGSWAQGDSQGFSERVFGKKIEPGDFLKAKL